MMHAQLLLACRRARMALDLPPPRRIVIQAPDSEETAVSITHTAPKIVFLSSDGTPTSDGTTQRTRALTVSLIQHVVANHFGIARIDMASKRRTKDVVLPRQVAMYFSRTMTLRSMGEMGLSFDRDHTTIMYGVDKIRDRIIKDEAFAAEIKSIKTKIEERTR